MPVKMKMCENMSLLVCDTSLLETTDFRLSTKSFEYKLCDRCDLVIPEGARHIIMQCPYFETERMSAIVVSTCRGKPARLVA